MAALERKKKKPKRTFGSKVMDKAAEVGKKAGKAYKSATNDIGKSFRERVEKATKPAYKKVKNTGSSGGLLDKLKKTQQAVVDSHKNKKPKATKTPTKRTPNRGKPKLNDKGYPVAGQSKDKTKTKTSPPARKPNKKTPTDKSLTSESIHPEKKKSGSSPSKYDKVRGRKPAAKKPSRRVEGKSPQRTTGKPAAKKPATPKAKPAAAKKNNDYSIFRKGPDFGVRMSAGTRRRRENARKKK